MLKCSACNKETCLELEFPDCIKFNKKHEAYRACVHCGAEVFPSDGRWVAQNPTSDLVGWWISQLNSIYVKPSYILELYENPPHGDLSEVMNSKLGRAYIPAENRLTQSDLFACLGQDIMLTKDEGPTCMGVDVGRELNVVIAEKTTRRTLKIVKVARVGTFNDLHDLAQTFGVKSAVIDLKPEIRKVREFQRNESYQVFACDYVETKTGQITWDEKDLVIKCNRTEICDASHDLVVTPGRLILPRRNTELDLFIKQMCNIAKILEEVVDTGAKTYKYKKVGKHDHYRHAMNYCLLASERVGVISDNKLIRRFFGRNKRRSWMTA